MKIDTALETPGGIIATASEWFDVEVSEQDAEAWCKKWNRRKSTYETSAGPLMWLKNRILETTLLKFGGAKLLSDWMTAELHVAFLFLEESEKMLERLRKPETTNPAGPARSKISKTQEVIAPIDRVANRVVPGFSDVPS